MKILRLLVAAAVLLIASAPLYAKKFAYPTKADAWFTIDIPDAWKPAIEDEAIEATAPEDAAYVTFWVLKNKSDFKSFEKDLDEILKDSVTDPKVTKPLEEKTVNGIKFNTFQGTGKDRKEKTPVSFEVWMFAPKPGKVGFLYFDRDTDVSADIMKSLQGIVESIKLAK
jgi:hypothetical protein